jgi:hypothetical protein
MLGKAKEALASATGNQDLGSEGRRQDVQAAASPERAESDARAQSPRTGAQRSLEAAEQVRIAATEEANRLGRVKQERKLD